MKFSKKLFLFPFFFSLSFILYSQADACKFIAEISIISVEKGAFLACTNSANPAACTIAFAAHNCGQDPACDGVVKEFVEKGCTYTVKVTADKIKVIGEASKEALFDLNKTWHALNTVEGIRWLEQGILGF
jgi:hypothetical protein